jgi:hypothetical protein
MTMTVNGVDISNLAYNVGDLTGRWTSPPKRGKDLDVPGRHGTVRTPRKKYSSGTVILPFWINGCNTDGTLPSDKKLRTMLQKNADRLSMLFSVDDVVLVQTLEDGSHRQVNGQVVDAIDMTVMAGASRAEFAVTLRVSGAFWKDTADVTESKTGTGVWNVSAFTGATAPMDDLIVKFTGPCTNPKLLSSSGVYVQYNAALTGSQSVAIDCGLWTLTGTSITPSYSALVHGGDPRWFVLDPGDVIPQVTASQTAGSTGVFALTGRRKYLLAG